MKTACGAIVNFNHIADGMDYGLLLLINLFDLKHS